MKFNTRHLLCTTVASVCLLMPTWASADCVDGTREVKPAERDFHDRAMAALLAVLPAAPAGVRVEGGQAEIDRVPALTFMCAEQKEGQFALLARRTYVLPADAAARERALQERRGLEAQIQALEKLPADKVAEQNRLKVRIDELEARRQVMLRNKDMASSDALYKNEINPLIEASFKVKSDHLASVKAQTDPLREKMRSMEVKDQIVRVAVAINQRSLPQQGGSPLVGSHGVAAPQMSAGLKVMNVSWGVSGDEGALRDAMASSLAVDRLRGMVGKPLPDVATSRASAASLPVPALPTGTQSAAAVPAVSSAVETPTLPPSSTPAPALSAPVPNTSAATAPPENTAKAPAVAASVASVAPAPKPDVLKQVTEGVQKLRGLFGR